MKVRVFGPDDGEQLERFLSLHERIYGGRPDYYPETASHRRIIGYYDGRSDYDVRLLLLEGDDGTPTGRVAVAACDHFDFVPFGFFECPDDSGAFEQLMERAADEARRLGASELRGPIDLNALHGWMFLEENASGERIIGDPYHEPYYPRLFREAGWEVGERQASGIVDEALHRTFVDELPDSLAAVEQEGLEIRNRNETDVEAHLPTIHRLVEDGYTAETNRYAPVDFEVFRASVSPILELVDDPESALFLFRGEAFVGFLLGYPNFVERLCGPGVAPTTRGRFATKSAAFDPAIQKGGGFRALSQRLAKHCDEVYGHRYAYRRLNLIGTYGHARMVLDRSEVTQRYATYRRDL